MRSKLRRLVAQPLSWLVLALVLESALLVKGQGDFVASDPLWYADIAHNISTGDFQLVFSPTDHHPFVMRVGLTVPLAGLYRLFGVSTLVSNLPAILSGLACIVLLFLVAPTRRAKAIALGYGLTSVALLHEANLLNIDLPCAVLLGYSVWFMQRRDEHRLWLLLAAVTAVAAFLVKETAVWCAPIWLWVVVVDARAIGVRETARRFAPAVIAGLVLVAGYLALCDVVWGTPLARLDGIRELTFEHSWILHGKPASAWIGRLTWQVPWLLFKMFHAALLPALAAPWLVRGRDRIWLVAMGTFLACYWFGSASTTAYTPLPITERMVLSVLPPVLVLATLATDEAIRRWGSRRWLAPVAAVIGLSLIVPAARTDFQLVRRSTPETDAITELRHHLTAGPAVLVVADPRGTAITRFYFGLDVQPSVQLVYLLDYPNLVQPADAHVYVLVNDSRGHDKQLSARISAMHLPVLYAAQTIHLYDAGDGASLR